MKAGISGRQGPLARLGGLLDHALAGRGGVALVSGEAGIGRSALVEALAGRAGTAAVAWGFGAPDATPYAPWRSVLDTLGGDHPLRGHLSVPGGDGAAARTPLGPGWRRRRSAPCAPPRRRASVRRAVLSAWDSPDRLPMIVERFAAMGIDEFVMRWPETPQEHDVFLGAAGALPRRRA